MIEFGASAPLNLISNIMQRYKSTSNCYKDVRPYVCPNKLIRDIREDFEDMFTAEAEFRKTRGDLSVVFCLTYNDEHLHTFYGRNVLDSDDLLHRISKASKFAKILKRKYGYEFDYIVVGEYGNGGVTHNCVGKRGSGQNPHYHGAGWFHKIDDTLPTPSYDILCQLLRDAWQGTSDTDIVVYANNMLSRSKGLGFCQIDGPIKCSSAGAFYISKYMGKDILTLHTDMLQELAPSEFIKIALDELKDYDCTNMLSSQKQYGLYLTWLSNLPWNHALSCRSKYVLENRIQWADPEYMLVPFITEYLDDLYRDFLVDFTESFNRISAKLRHFHGFGYSLLDGANLAKGYYKRPFVGTKRKLPPSLCRKAYYDYHVALVPQDILSTTKPIFHKHYDDKGRKHECLSRYKKQVVYTLNSVGVQHLTLTTTSSINCGIMRCKTNNLDVSPLAVALAHTFYNCHLTQEYFDALIDTIDKGNIKDLVSLYIQLPNCVVPDWFRELNEEYTYSVNQLLSIDYGKLFSEIEIYLKTINCSKDYLDKMAKDFNEANKAIYLSTY